MTAQPLLNSRPQRFRIMKNLPPALLFFLGAPLLLPALACESSESTPAAPVASVRAVSRAESRPAGRDSATATPARPASPAKPAPSSPPLPHSARPGYLFM